MARQKSIDGDIWLEQRAFDKKSQRIRTCFYSLMRKRCIWDKPPKGATDIHRWIKNGDIESAKSLSREHINRVFGLKDDQVDIWIQHAAIDARTKEVRYYFCSFLTDLSFWDSPPYNAAHILRVNTPDDVLRSKISRRKSWEPSVVVVTP
eukprot:scaffold8835_cov41-Attheya_sp.AAC.2